MGRKISIIYIGILNDGENHNTRFLCSLSTWIGARPVAQNRKSNCDILIECFIAISVYEMDGVFPTFATWDHQLLKKLIRNNTGSAEQEKNSSENCKIIYNRKNEMSIFQKRNEQIFSFFASFFSGSFDRLNIN